MIAHSLSVPCSVVDSFGTTTMLDNREARRTAFAKFALSVLISVTFLSIAGAPLSAQSATSLEALLARADSVNPTIQAAQDRVLAARARIGPAGAWADPMLMAGIENLPLASTNAAAATGHGNGPSIPGDPMTMKMIGVAQTIPYPGKLALRKRAAEREVDAAIASLDASRLGVARDVQTALFELTYLDRALQIAEQNSRVLGDIVRVTEAHYSTGVGGQEDIFKARVEAAHLGETANAVLEQRRAVVAQLNEYLDRDSETPVEAPELPVRIVRAAVAADASAVRFTAQSLGARAAGSPLPPLSDLQDLAVRQNPTLRESEARIAAQIARVALAEKEYKPDFDISLQYGQRNQRPDMITAQVAIPIPLHRKSRQDQEVSEARAELSAMEAEHKAQVNSIRSRVARLASGLERSRTQLALYVKAILPQGSAAATSALASYQSGKADLRTVLDNQNTLFTYQTEYYRALSDFAKNLAELEQVVGSEVVR